MTCPRCGSHEATPWGGTGNARKRYKCKKCGRQYYDPIDKIEERYSADELRRLMEPRQVFEREAIKFDGETVKIGVMTDTHIGSSYTDESHIVSALAEFERQGVSMILHAGDVTEGMSGRDGHVYELSRIGYKAQRDAAVELFKLASAPMYFISGNHDRWYLKKGDIGADIVGDIADKLGARMLGHDEGDLTVNGIVIRLWHGEDAGSYAVSYRLQKIVESFTGGEKPNVLIAGHTHKSAYLFDRNVHVISAGSIQSQSKWMRGKRIAAHRGFWTLCLTIADNEVKSCQPTWYPIY
jgi:predicted phosphodiesterase/DNA-directed RNA polymerase subunit RPC12/RpoP